MKAMKVNYLAGCVTCNDGLTDHIADLLESGEADTQMEAVRQVTEALNEKLGYAFFSEKKILGKYKRTLQERSGYERPCNVECKNTQNVDTEEFSSNSQEETIPPFDVQARQEAVKRMNHADKPEDPEESKCRKSTLKPETTPVIDSAPSQMEGLGATGSEGLTYKELEYKLSQAIMTRDSYEKQLSHMRKEVLELRPALEKAKSELEEQTRQNGIMALALYENGINYSLS